VVRWLVDGSLAVASGPNLLVPRLTSGQHGGRVRIIMVEMSEQKEWGLRRDISRISTWMPLCVEDDVALERAEVAAGSPASLDPHRSRDELDRLETRSSLNCKLFTISARYDTLYI
jgi:hypothetical protein